MSENTSKGKSRRVWWLLLVLLLVSAVWFFTSRKATTEKKEATLDEVVEVKRGDFNITVVVDGTLDAIKRYDLKCEARGRFELTILKIVEDNARVKKGDVVVEFSREKAEEQLEKMKLQLDDSERDLALSREDIQMKETTNISSIKAAADQLCDAEEALRKYIDLESPKKKRELQTGITKATDGVEGERKVLTEIKEESSSANSLDAAKLAEFGEKLKAAEKKLETAEGALSSALHASRVYKQYDYPQQMRKLQEALSKAQLNMKKVLVDAKGNVIQAQRRITSHEERSKQLRTEIEKMQEDISKLIIKAPVAGIVYHGNPNRRHWQEPKEMKVGTNVYSREIICSIPDLSKFMVKTMIPEEQRSRIRLKLPATLYSPAVPDLVMKGVVSEISPSAKQSNYRIPDSPKVYDTKVSTDTSDERLMPGMTVKIEIIVKNLKDVLYVPVEAVYNKEGVKFARVQTALGESEKKVETGRSSMDFVEILKGLSVGEEVMLIRRSGLQE